MQEIDKQEETSVEEETTEETQESTEDSTDWEAEAKKYKRIAEQRLKKLEAKETPKEEKKEPSKQSPDADLMMKRLDKQALRIAEIKEADEVELAESFKERLGYTMEEVIEDDIFQAKLEKLRETKSNKLAMAGIKEGGTGKGSPKDTPEYWISQGKPPTPEQVPDRKKRVAIVRAFMANAKKGKTFYNE